MSTHARLHIRLYLSGYGLTLDDLKRLRTWGSITAPWRLFTGETGASIGVDHFGASADYEMIYREFGITADRVAAAARDNLARV